MRKLFTLLICIVFTTNIFAQWGIKGGIDLSTLTLYREAKSQVGFHLGAIYDIPMSSKFYFQPGLLFTSNGFDFKKNILVKKANISMYAIEVPLLFSFRPRIGNKIKIITNFGLYARYGLFGTKKYEFTDNTSKKESSYGPYNRFDLGIDLGIGLSYKKISFIGSYQSGLTNAEKEISKFQHRKYRISVGYSF